MKKSHILLALLLLIIVSGCSNHTNYEENGPFITVSTSSNSAEPYEKSYSVTYSVHEDGTLVLSTDPLKVRGKVIEAEAPPEHEIHINDAAIEETKTLIEKSDFWKMEEDISVESDDGGYIYITVHLTDQSKEVGGLNPNDENFLEIEKYVSSLVSSNDFKTWDKRVKEYLLENNPRK